MAKTDQPLKRLITRTITEFASWVLNAEVRSVTPVSIEQTAIPDPIRSDLVFRVTLADDRTVLMPIEFQGSGSHKPVKLRVLDYVSRIAINEQPDFVVFVVVYIGNGTGRSDTGKHQIAGLGEQPALTWNYCVIHLWDFNAEELLKLNRPALLPLVGLTRIDRPNVVIPQVIEQLKTIPDHEHRSHMYSELLALMSDERMIAMTKRILELEEEELFDSPFLRGIREESMKIGREEGIQTGIEIGHLRALREYILDTLEIRFNPPIGLYRRVERIIATINDEITLHTLFTQTLRAENFDEFQAIVTQLAQDNL